MNNNLLGISGKMGSGKDTVGQIIQYLVYDKKAREEVKGYIWCDEMFLESLEKDPEMFKTEPYKIVKFADKLKDCVCLLLGCTREQLEDQAFKKKPLGEEWSYYVRFNDLTNKLYSHFEYRELPEIEKDSLHKIYLTPRIILQLLGTDCGRNIIHPDIWANSTMVDYKPAGYYMCDRCDNEYIPELIKIPSRFKEQGYLEDEYVCPHCKGEESEEDLTMVLSDTCSKWLITDCRFPNELRAIKEHGGVTIRVNRPCKICGGVGYHKMSCSIAKNGEHESETALDESEFDYIIINDGTLLDLVQKVRALLIELQIIPW